MEAAVTTAQALEQLRNGGRTRAVAAAAGIAALTGIAATLGASAGGDNAAMSGLLRATMVAAPLGVAAYAATVEPYQRFARILCAVGFASFVSTFAEASDAELYAVGRAAGWAVEVLLVIALLAFPGGRISARVDRRLVMAMTAIVVGLYGPTLLVAPSLKVPSPYTSCTADCPRNAFAVVGDASTAGSALFAVASALVFVVMLGVLVRLHHRVLDAGPLERQLLLPVLAVGMGRAALVGITIVGRDLGGARPVAGVSAWLIAWAMPVISLAFLAGVVRSRLFAEQALRHLATAVRWRPDVAALERAFVQTFDDPDIEIVFPRNLSGRGWIDARGHPLELDATSGRRALHVLRGRDGSAVAALVCHPALAGRPELLGAAGDLAAVALENLRLTADARALARDAHASRARIAAAADRERRRIERDLHDGAQQRLVALRIELSLLEDVAVRDPPRCARRIHELEDEVEEALEELRSLAHGVCPPLLADRGLAEALQAAASRATVPITLRCRGLARYAPEIETAVYFCVLEALQNVAKHAADARRVAVSVTADGEVLRFSISDDGPGARRDQLRRGAGVTNMRDRIAAIGGQVEIIGRPGTGTEVRGRVPVAPRLSPQTATQPS